MRNDTIVAVATPAGVGGIAVVRLSGSDALATALRHLDVDSLPARRATYCRFDELDDIVATYFPRGYTGEPTVELSCHGSLYVQQAVLEALTADGARLAEAGEYTMRAFRNGRLNLSQAEAVADLIDAVTPVQHRLAVSQLRGGYADELKGLRQRLVELTALMELELDFSQEDVEFADRRELRRLLDRLAADIERLTDSFALGNALKRGVPVAIVGAPNAGKSSLLNALLGDDRAIVSDIPGTTRDTVEETLTLDGILFRFVDTAGLRHAADAVEAEGVRRSLRAVGQASVVLYVSDATAPWQAPDIDLEGKTVIYVQNKCDLAAAQATTAAASAAAADGQVRVSALTGQGLDALKQKLSAAVKGTMDGHGRVLLTNERHLDALRHVQQALRFADESLTGGMPADLVVVDLRDALYHLGTITGEVASDEVLATIFSRFCIGK